MIMRRVCAWCNRILPSREYQCSPDPTIEEPVSHSICAECFEKVLDEIASAQTKPIQINE